jgi:DNA-binding transcriptional LysR family regulator
MKIFENLSKSAKSNLPRSSTMTSIALTGLNACWKKRPTQILPSNSLELIARLTDAGVGYGIIPTRTVKMLKLRLNRAVEAPEQRDEIAIVYRPEFGKTEQEKGKIESIKRSFSE